ncbi:MAG: hypothetical protein HY236_01120 [Acidobacteria bacterium]|nr:hypothetical protein [Acidobacteriota bacterium]
MRRPSYQLLAAIAYLLLASIYLIYLPHAEFVLDDWFILERYQAARDAGGAEPFRVAVAIFQNLIHNQFRFYWLSFLTSYLVWLAAGYAPGVVFAVILLVHAWNAILLRQTLERLGIGSRPAFLVGVVFLLAPAAHSALFWSFNISCFVWSTVWFVLYWRSLAASLVAGRLEGRAAARQALFLVLALFSGDPVFGLLVATAPLTAWFLRSKTGLRATLLAWGTVLTAAGFYTLLVNKAPLMAMGFGLRYEFSPRRSWENFIAIINTYRRLTGLGPGAFYRLQFTWQAGAAALLAAAVTLLGLRRADAEKTPALRTCLLAAGLWLAAYGPIWFLRAHEYRYDYVPAPYLALALATAALAVPALRMPLAAALAGWLAMATLADMGQCWIPQSRNLRAIAARLRQLPVEPHDLIIVSNTPLWLGTAPHFAFLAGWASTPFAEHVTGVHGLEAACEIVSDAGRLRVYHRNYMRDLKPDEPRRSWVLVVEANGEVTERRLLAQEIRGGAYRLYPLKGYTGPAPSPREFTREQLDLAASDIYFAAPFSHQERQGPPEAVHPRRWAEEGGR